MVRRTLSKIIPRINLSFFNSKNSSLLQIFGISDKEQFPKVNKGFNVENMGISLIWKSYLMSSRFSVMPLKYPLSSSMLLLLFTS